MTVSLWVGQGAQLPPVPTCPSLIVFCRLTGVSRDQLARWRASRAETLFLLCSTYGWALSESGHQVARLVRSGRAAALSDGVSFDMFDRRKGHAELLWLYKLDVSRRPLHIKANW